MNKGREYEDAAVDFLKAKGFRIKERNYKTRWGEIDIIAEKQRTVYFVEVKGRKAQSWYAPEEAVVYHKQQRVLRAAQWYAQQHALDNNLSLSVVSIVERNGAKEIEFFEDVVEG